MPGFGDTTFILLLALLLFGPKKLPVLARQLGKLMADFRRASNEFKTQMEEELRISEQAERQKQIAAMEAAAPQQAIPEPEHPHLPAPPNEAEPATSSQAEFLERTGISSPPPEPAPEPALPAAEPPAPTPLPIASAGDLNLMPPATGLPISRGAATTHTGTQTGTLAAEDDTAPGSRPQAAPSDRDQPVHAGEAEARPWRL